MLVESGVRLGLRAISSVSTNAGGRLAARLWFSPFPMGIGRTRGVDWADDTIIAGRLPVHRYGSGNRRALLVHGWSGSSRQYRRMAEALAQTDYTVFIPDLPAHGEAEGTATDVPDLVDALATVGAALGRFDLIVAHSLGSMATAVGLAEGGLETDRLVLVAPSIEPRVVVQKFADEAGLTDGVAEYLVGLMEQRFGTDIWDRIPQAVLGLDVPQASVVIHDLDDDRSPVDVGRRISHAWHRPLIETTGHGHNRVLRAAESIDAVVAAAGTEVVASEHSYG